MPVEVVVEVFKDYRVAGIGVESPQCQARPLSNDGNIAQRVTGVNWKAWIDHTYGEVARSCSSDMHQRRLVEGQLAAAQVERVLGTIRRATAGIPGSISTS